MEDKYTVTIQETAPGQVEGYISNGDGEQHFYQLKAYTPDKLYAYLHAFTPSEAAIPKRKSFTLDDLAFFTAKGGGVPARSFLAPVLVAYRKLLTDRNYDMQTTYNVELY